MGTLQRNEVQFLFPYVQGGSAQLNTVTMVTDSGLSISIVFVLQTVSSFDGISRSLLSFFVIDFQNNADYKNHGIIDKYENVTEENSDDDFQPNITRKRKSREPTPVNSSQKRMKKGKEKPSSSTSTAIVESKSSDDAPLTKSTVSTAKHNAVGDSNNSSANANTVKKRAVAVKTTVKSIWKPNYTQALHELVNIANTLVAHTFAFSKHILLKELEEGFNFDLSDYIRKEFFVEVFLSLIVRINRPGRLLVKTANYRSLVSKHKESYCRSASYTLIVLVNAQQIALLSAILNKLCKTKELAADLRKDLKKKSVDKRAINKALREEAYGPCNQVKRAIEKKEIPDATIFDTSARKKSQSHTEVIPKQLRVQKGFHLLRRKI
ncbi:hypothetical protein RMATCC62417_11330 [Rhizopus microsporus]|nr:hypothetical protein RMATCC62417_11330 [Rhizopus microsporus]